MKKKINTLKFERNTDSILLIATTFSLKPGYQKTDNFQNQNFTDYIAYWRLIWSAYIAAKNLRSTTRYFSCNILLQDAARSPKNSF